VHELSLVQALLQLITDQAAEHGFQRVNRVRLSCGRLAGVEPRALEFAFTTVRDGTLCARARLELETRPLKLYCFDCGQERISETADPTTCPGCGGGQVTITGGFEELRLEELDVD